MQLTSAYAFHLRPQHLMQGPVQPKADALAACQTSYTRLGAILTHRGQKPFKTEMMDSPGDTVVKNPPANAGDTGLIPGPGRSHMLRSN